MKILSFTFALILLSLQSYAAFPITAKPSAQDWQFQEIIYVYQAAAGVEAKAKLATATLQELEQGVAETYEQMVETSPGVKEKMSVEISQILISIPLDKLIKVLPSDQWGTHLAHYLGGEVQVIDRDAMGRTSRQIERMVLSGLPFDIDANFANQDMTKAEILVYGESSTTVLWRVYNSDNNSTLVDLGKVEFRTFPSDVAKTLVTFHSAHRIQALGTEVPGFATRYMLKKVFLDHLRQYKKLCEQ